LHKYCESSWIIRAFSREYQSFRFACAASRGGLHKTETIYDGSAPLHEFFAQFNLRPHEPLKRANKDHYFGFVFARQSVCRGKHAKFRELESMQNLENLQFEELKSKLEMRFGETTKLLFTYKTIIRNILIENRNSEKISLLWVLIERLSQLAKFFDSIQSFLIRFAIKSHAHNLFPLFPTDCKKGL